MSVPPGLPRFAGIPDIIYGTAFKFEDSQRLVKAALEAGFRGVDTAGSASAYREKLVGDAIKAVLSKGVTKREELWVMAFVLDSIFSFLHYCPNRSPTDPDKVQPL